MKIGCCLAWFESGVSARFKTIVGNLLPRLQNKLRLTVVKSAPKICELLRVDAHRASSLRTPLARRAISLLTPIYTHIMSQPAFVHLRLHSEYSISDGMVRLDEAVASAQNDGMPALALTDLSNFSGLVKFYKSALGKGIKPVAGCYVFITNEADRDRPYRLLLLCQSVEGYLRLCRLLSRAYLTNQYRERPELRREWFREEGTGGLICLSGAHLGDVGCALMSGNAAFARQFAREWAELFDNRYYLEVQRAGFVDEESYIHLATLLAAELDLPVVATHPVQFSSIEDFKAHEARVCIAEGYVLNDKRREKAFTPQQYFKTQAEMLELFR